MEQPDQIPNIAELALQYGTINTEQFHHLQKLYTLKQKEDPAITLGQLILNLNFATQYQVGLLKLIEDYLIIKKQGVVFGRIAIEKGFATEQDIEKALEYQKKEFRRAKLRKLIGDILVESGVITVKQKNSILMEQTLLDTKAEKILSEAQPEEYKPDGGSPAIKEQELSDYEKKFLQIKALDKEFAATVIEKGFATEVQVRTAQIAQEDAFEKENRIQVLGDFMVRFNFMSEEQRNIVLKEQQGLDGISQPEDNAGITIRISKDKMEAVVKINRDIEKLSFRDIRRALHNKGIKVGIYSDSILQCNLDMKNTEFVAANPAFSLDLIKNRKASYCFDIGQVGTQEKKMGVTLAEQSLGGEAYIIKDLFGNNREQPKDYQFRFRCASGTRLSDDQTKVIAGKTGFPSLSIEKKLYIHPTISILEDADLRRGPLEPYANLKISGILTGSSYSITAGDLYTKEIRDARIDAIGTVRSEFGITNSYISTQGDIHARYLHNCRVESFGNVFIENEIIDSDVFSSGKIDSKHCRVVSSTLFAKKGIDLSGVGGSNRVKACILGAGTEHHILEKAKALDLEIKEICSSLDELKEKRDEKDKGANKTFQKMVELKLFHDRAKNKKLILSNEFKSKKDIANKEELKNIVSLVHVFEKRMEDALGSLKELNRIKKKFDKESYLFQQKIKKLEPGIQKKIAELKIDMLTFFEWAKKQVSHPSIKIRNQAYSGTVFKGVYSSLSIETELNNFTVMEKQNTSSEFKLVLEKH
ncbi:MAG: FapA family protein [Desulfobacula sp.]